MKKWIELNYTEDEIFDLVTRLFNEGYFPENEHADIEDLLYGLENGTFPGVPYLFNMTEEDEEEEEIFSLPITSADMEDYQSSYIY